MKQIDQTLALLRVYAQSKSNNQPRHFILIEDTGDARESIIEQFADATKEVAALMVSDTGYRRCIPPRQVVQYLGQEFECVLLDGYSGINPNVLGQLSGLIQGGGSLLLLMPPLAVWPYFHDPEIKKINDIANPIHYGHNFFLQHFARCIEQYRQYETQKQDIMHKPAACSETERLAEQHAVLETIMSHFFVQKRQSPVILTADRGRGKSGALGILSARAQALGYAITVTASGRSALVNVFKHFEQAWEESEEPALLHYKAPWDLVQQADALDLLIVDEAATMPVHTLLALCNKFKRVILATTLHGYEGSGSGFAGKLVPLLARRFSRLLQLELKTPLRWPGDDPLERLMNNVLLTHKLTDGPASSMPRRQVEINEWAFYEVSRQHLISDYDLLMQVFHLLMTAHYQTTPGDLRFLLDAGHTRLFVLGSGSSVLAVALVCIEGEWSNDQIEAVALGRRRFKGDFLAQSLVLHTACPELAGRKIWRVMRIAVQPSKQSQGLGHCLLQRVEKTAREAGIDLIGTTFGLNDRLLAFWLDLHFKPIRLGVKRDNVSGLFSLCMLKHIAMNDKALEPLQENFGELMLYQSSHRYRAVSALATARLLASCPLDCKVFKLSVVDLWSIKQFAQGYRELASVELALYRLTVYCLLTASKQDITSLTLFVALFIQKRDRSDIVETFGLMGKKDLLQRVRQQVSIFMGACYDAD